MFPRPKSALAAALWLGLLAAPLQAECIGSNILDEMSEAERSAVRAAADAVPFPSGNQWTLTRGTERMTVVGTYHMDDPRHAETLSRLKPLIADAAALLVEAGPDEEKALLDRMARDPSVIAITNGPTLKESLPPETWARLSAAMAERGIPAFMAAKFQPWYVTVLLSVPPCAMTELQDPKGLDGMLIDTAMAEGVQIKALEPYDTVFGLFDRFSQEERADMIEQSLLLEPRIVDFSTTLADSYFAGESRLMWELMRFVSYGMEGQTREKVDAEMAVMEEVLMAERNRAWIPVIEDTAAAEDGPLVVAFGALHLSGEDGVLNLLARNGWQVAPLAAAPVAP